MEIGASVTAVKGALDLARSAKDVNDRAQLNAAVSDIMDKLTTAQSGLFEMQHQYQQLIEENQRLQQALEKEARFDRYRKEETPQGDWVLSLKEDFVTPDEPPHSICPLCREEGRYSLMSRNSSTYRCGFCKYVAKYAPSGISDEVLRKA